MQLIYTARLRKYKHADEHALTRRRLTEEFGLGDNPDVLFSFADALYAQFRWADCFLITSRCVVLLAYRKERKKLINQPTNEFSFSFFYVQDPGSSSSPRINDALARSRHVSPLAPPLKTVHARSRIGRSRTGEPCKLVYSWSVVSCLGEVGAGEAVFQVSALWRIGRGRIFIYLPGFLVKRR